MTDRKKYTQQFKDEAVELVISSGRQISQVCLEIGVLEGTLGNWVRKYREDHPDRVTAGQEKAPVSLEQHQKALAEIAKLKQDVDFLGKISAYFAAKQRSRISTSSSKQRRRIIRSPVCIGS